MTRKRITIAAFVLLVLVASAVVGYLVTRDTVRVTDAVSGLPIRGAQVVPIYPSFGGPPYQTNRRGVARIGGFGLPRGGCGVQVTAAGYSMNFIPTYPSATNHEGWRGNHRDIVLWPVSRP